MSDEAPAELSDNAPAQWADLRTRVISGVLMALVGIVAILLGGGWFQMLAAFAVAVVVWEVWRMIDADQPTPEMLIPVLAASIVAALPSITSGWGLLLLLVVPVIGAIQIRQNKPIFFAFSLGIMAAGWALISYRSEYGLSWMLWLVLVVIVTDTAGYFAGKRFGGAKFWPKVSPKKTWSGTIAGWVGAAIVGLVFLIATPAGFAIVPISIALSFASQMGDIAESALKRHVGIKDSSNLIPGHGGLYDRFDGMLGAALFLMVLAMVTGVPGVTF